MTDNKHNAVIISLFIFVFLGIFLAGANFSETLTGKATETEKGILKIFAYPEGVSVTGYYTPVGGAILRDRYSGERNIDFGVVNSFGIVKTLPPGKYILTFQKPGYGTEIKLVSVYKGRTETISIQMEALGSVSVASKPSGAKVSFYYNGKLVLSGITPVTQGIVGKSLPSGKYNVVFEKEGYKTVTKNVEVKTLGITNI